MFSFLGEGVANNSAIIFYGGCALLSGMCLVLLRVAATLWQTEPRVERDNVFLCEFMAKNCLSQLGVDAPKIYKQDCLSASRPPGHAHGGGPVHDNHGHDLAPIQLYSTATKHTQAPNKYKPNLQTEFFKRREKEPTFALFVADQILLLLLLLQQIFRAEVETAKHCHCESRFQGNYPS